MLEEQYRQIAKEMIMAGVKAADPTASVQSNVSLDKEAGILTICGQKYALKDYQKILLFGVGKAACPMVAAFEQIIKPDDGAVITKIGSEISQVPVNSVPVYYAYHPEPREINVEKTREIISKIESLDPKKRSLVVMMVSGGGSALFCMPAPSISVEDMFRLNELLMKCGATIHHINIIRKHVDMVKGGRFGRLCVEHGADVATLIVSDVVGDDLSTIASGPTYKDDSTFADAIDLMKRYKIWDEAPLSIRAYLEKGLNDPSLEPPREIPAGVSNFLIGTNLTAMQAAKQVAEKHGFNTIILTTQNRGEAKIVSLAYMGIAKEIQDSGNPISPPAALIVGGEMIVTFDWEDRDGFGPNREFVLSGAIEIAGRPNLVIAGADTDGVDGEGKSGAIADGRTIARSKLDPDYYLNKHDAEIFFDALGDSLQFQSRTNVNDIIVILVGPKN
ncbi:MAG TPA: DUF4147 domain-containing protein [Firmicutes bacterium]|nr:DUF4147 domain-containing protein [Bacillota bacterium]